MLIKKLSQGEIAVKNDGTLEELREVIKVAFPDDKIIPEGKDRYYVRSVRINGKVEWIGKSYTDLPAHSVKELYAELHPELTVGASPTIPETTTTEWQPKWGEEVEVSEDSQHWWPGLFVGKHPRNERYITTHTDNDRISTWCHIRPLSTLSLTLEEIAKKFGVQKVEIVKSK